ncbi:MerR family transcriptional regulator [Undibacterium sp. Ren11W]|uniref:MerR family transcriptional regulator n=1 Tax=Undibacterium sp. Ren11W TaxID=3413045 RepID=UPI003BF4375F
MSHDKNQTSDQLTIGQLARAAGVGLETIRYYQRRALLPVPVVARGYRTYPLLLVQRIRFIKRAQELGFSLAEITTLLQLEDNDDRIAIRKVAADRLLQVEEKLEDLQKMQKMLTSLIHECEATAQTKACPIIHALAEKGSMS